MNRVLSQLTSGRYSQLNLLADAVLVSVSYMLTLGSGEFGIHLLLSATFVGLCWFIGTALTHYYDPFAQRSAGDDATLLLVQLGGLAVVLDLIGWVLPDSLASPRPIRFLLLALPLLLPLRHFLFRRLRKIEKPVETVVIVGTGMMGRETAGDLRASKKVLGFVQLVGTPPADLEIVGANIEEVLRKHVVDEVYITGNPLKTPEIAKAMQATINTCEKFGVPFALPAQPFRFDNARAYHAGLDNGYLHYSSIEPKRAQMTIKRIFDIVASTAALWALAPLFLLVAALIKVSSKGPVFFKQTRVGLHGSTFGMLKFRSMVVDAEQLKEKLMAFNEQQGPVFKMKHDPRITRIGRFIRKYSIDELPQLVNVLRGDMSIVGPRPPVPSEVAKYEAWQRRRLSVRPGLTCIWQVSGRSEITFEQWMYLDMLYVDTWSLWLDVSLIAKTLPVVVTGRGAS